MDEGILPSSIPLPGLAPSRKRPHREGACRSHRDSCRPETCAPQQQRGGGVHPDCGIKILIAHSIGQDAERFPPIISPVAPSGWQRL